MLPYIHSLISEVLRKRSIEIPDFTVEHPKNPDFGDISTNVAMKLAGILKKNPLKIAEEIREELLTLHEFLIQEIECVRPGFINFYISDHYYQSLVEKLIEEDKNFMKPEREGKKVQIEFVSANPTGPLTIGHGRQAVLGDTIARILEWYGNDVTREYYFNNAGRQMQRLGESVYARCKQLLGKDYPIPEGGYEGEYIRDIASDYLKEREGILPENPLDRDLIDFASDRIFKMIRETLDRLGVHHDIFTNEKDLYTSGKIDEVLALLREKGYLYDKEGAVWFRATCFGAEKDRVFVKSSGEPTYRLPDIAYHREKLLRGFDLIIDIFGADHHATYPDVKAGLEAMGYDTSNIVVLLHQFVTLTRNGEKVKMSTRKANFVTLDELMDLAGPDVVRYFYIMRTMDAHLNFDIELAQKESDENPVFYLQYAHARMNNILKHSVDKGIDSYLDGDIQLLNEPETLDVLKVVSEFGEVMELCRRTLEPMHLTSYLQKLATAFHKFYATHRVVTEDLLLSRARLKMVHAVKTLMAEGLGILGVSAPDHM
ncbi:MAG: arginyl-tRNA synthetase [Candidatus Marinimicrobia bacterium]|nr:arginyl-tRNA synthetase [Candidatus Neomarinimicrobiota bacterium]